jgi:GT2 family glycosyltransferase
MVVSIIIPNFNGEKYLNTCLESIYKQKFKSYEIFVIDNNSNDNSCNIIAKKYCNVKVIKLNRNEGFSKAVNLGIQASNSEFIVLLNNDTEAEETWLENLVIAIKKDKKIFSCSSKMIQYYNRNIIDDAGDYYTLFGWTVKRGEGKPIKNFNDNVKIFSSCAGAAIYRRSILEEIGYFDELFFAYMEDVDIGYRALLSGYKNVYCSRALVYHIGSATSGSKHNKFKVKLSARNNIYLILNNMPMLQIFFNLPFIICGYIIKYIYFKRLGFGNDYKQGFIEAIINAKKIKRNGRISLKKILMYIKIEIILIANTFRFFLFKISK